MCVKIITYSFHAFWQNLQFFLHVYKSSWISQNFMERVSYIFHAHSFPFSRLVFHGQFFRVFSWKRNFFRGYKIMWISPNFMERVSYIFHAHSFPFSRMWFERNFHVHMLCFHGQCLRNFHGRKKKITGKKNTGCQLRLKVPVPVPVRLNRHLGCTVINP